MADIVNESNLINNRSFSSDGDLIATLRELDRKHYVISGNVARELAKRGIKDYVKSQPGKVATLLISPNVKKADTGGNNYIPQTNRLSSQEEVVKNKKKDEKSKVKSEVNQEIDKLTDAAVAELSKNEKIKTAIENDENINKKIRESIKEIVDAEQVLNITVKDKNGNDKNYQEFSEKIASKSDEHNDLTQKITNILEKEGPSFSDQEKIEIGEKLKTKVIEEFQKWEENEIETVVEYRKYNLEEKIEKSILSLEENKNLNSQQRAKVMEYSQMIAGMAFSSTAIELQRRELSGVNGMNHDSWNDLKNLFAVGQMSATDFKQFNIRWTEFDNNFSFDNSVNEGRERGDRIIVLPFNIRGYFDSFMRMGRLIGNSEGQVGWGKLRNFVQFFQKFNGNKVELLGSMLGKLGVNFNGSVLGKILSGKLGSLAAEAVAKAGGQALMKGLMAGTGPWGWAIMAAKAILDKLAGMFKKLFGGGPLDDLGVPKGARILLTIVLVVIALYGGTAMASNMTSPRVPPADNFATEDDDYDDIDEDLSSYTAGPFSAVDVNIPTCNRDGANENGTTGRLQLEKIAVSVRGKVPYNRAVTSHTWRCIGWCADWWHKSSGTYSYYGFDCAKFVSWVYYQCIPGEKLGGSGVLKGNAEIKRTSGGVNWNFISPESVSDLKIGDIFYRSRKCDKNGDGEENETCAHVVLYIGVVNGEPTTIESTRKNGNPHTETITNPNSLGTDGGVHLSSGGRLYTKIIRVYGVFSDDN